MKLVTLFLASTLVPAAALAQTAAQHTFSTDLEHTSQSQVGCPVAFTSVSLENKVHMMLVNQYDPASNSSLSFQYKNRSNKQIQSVAVQVELRIKRSIYDLDTNTLMINLTLTGNETSKLPLTTRAYGLGRVTLQQVTYTDGTIWTASEKSPCQYEAFSGAQQIGKLQ